MKTSQDCKDLLKLATGIDNWKRVERSGTFGNITRVFTSDKWKAVMLEANGMFTEMSIVDTTAPSPVSTAPAAVLFQPVAGIRVIETTKDAAEGLKLCTKYNINPFKAGTGWNLLAHVAEAIYQKNPYVMVKYAVCSGNPAMCGLVEYDNLPDVEAYAKANECDVVTLINPDGTGKQLHVSK